MSRSRSRYPGCNRDATAAVETKLRRNARAIIALLAMLLICGSTRAAAQEADGVAATLEVPALPQIGFGLPALGSRPPQDPGAESPTASPNRVLDTAKFLGGAAVGLLAHEAGHLAFDYTFHASPGVKRVSFGPLPFFAITHHPISPRREFVVSSAGFWVQQLGNEVLLSARPDLRSARAPMAKGLFAFNVITSMAYAGGAFAHAGPPERDTRSMAVFLGVDEAAVGAMLLGPAIFDTVRYYRPKASWAKWASRAAKVAMVLLVVRKGR